MVAHIDGYRFGGALTLSVATSHQSNDNSDNRRRSGGRRRQCRRRASEGEICLTEASWEERKSSDLDLDLILRYNELCM